MSNSYLSSLNPQQKEAVLDTDGPSLVIAGAGAGKTRVLTYRIARLLEKGVPSHSILALTFTNKAAGEMKERIMKVVGQEAASSLWIGTFHSIFARILRIDGHKLGYNQNFTIYDASDTKSLLRQIIKELNLDDKIYKASSVYGRISAAKNNLITSAIYSGRSELVNADRANRVPEISTIYTHYAARCFRANAMDFDDLLVNTNILLRDFPEILEHYRQKFRFVLVDEYQDTNYAQYLIVKQLSATHRNLCVVGDDAQSIYSFRGARIENILNFKNDYPDYKLFKLEQNYRSTQTIVNLANGIIENNEGQIKKKIFSENEKGENVRIFQCVTDGDEGFTVASDIFDVSLRHQLTWDKFSVLYRTNAQSRIFEEAFRKKNIPYRIYGGLSFYDRKEIKDILAYFRMTVNPYDEEALRRSVNYPKRGIGDTTIERIFEAAVSRDLKPWDIISGELPEQLLPNALLNKLQPYTSLINSFRRRLESTDAFNLAKDIALETGIFRELREGQLPEEKSRFENLEELLNGVKEFTESAQTNGEPEGLDAFLASVSLLTDMDNDKDDDRNKVTLMTVHSAKGLEFRNVYLVGLEDNLFPSGMNQHNPRDLEEERRLFYVAITRAEKELTISYALNRYKWGNLERGEPSRFLKELDEKYIYYPNAKSARPGAGIYTRESEAPAYKPKPLVIPPSGKMKPMPTGNRFAERQGSGETVTEISVGDRVEHERFGKGVIEAIEGEAPNTTAMVNFVEGGKRKLLLRFAKLRRIM